MQILSNPIQIVHALMLLKLQNSSVIVDATVGNGMDLKFILEHTSNNCKIYAMDIQKQAIINTKINLLDYDLTDVQLILDSHENFSKYYNGLVDFVIFNLGYLPNGNHNITTSAKSTISAIKYFCNNLNKNGNIAIVLYPGHEEGKKEEELILNFLKNLPKNKFTVGYYNMINHVPKAPSLCWIEKVV